MAYRHGTTAAPVVWGLLLAIGLVSAGCGSDLPPLAPVQGTITLAGKPLADAEVIFAPESGRQSAAKTDIQGKYELVYLPGVKGARLGPHTVRVSQLNPDTLLEGVPAKYNAQSTLKVEVKSDSNEFNFDLTRD